MKEIVMKQTIKGQLEICKRLMELNNKLMKVQQAKK